MCNRWRVGAIVSCLAGVSLLGCRSAVDVSLESLAQSAELSVLVRLPGPDAGVVLQEQGSVRLQVLTGDAGAACPVLQGVTATVDGVPLVSSPGGVVGCELGECCEPIEFDSSAWAWAGGGSEPDTIVLSDSTATWTLTVADLLASRSVVLLIPDGGALLPGETVALQYLPAAADLDGGFVAVTFGPSSGAESFSAACTGSSCGDAGELQLAAGNRLSFELPDSGFAGPGVFSVGVFAPSPPFSCQGPASCSIELASSPWLTNFAVPATFGP